jgi:hypothetical protein
MLLWRASRSDRVSYGVARGHGPVDTQLRKNERSASAPPAQTARRPHRAAAAGRAVPARCLRGAAPHARDPRSQGPMRLCDSWNRRLVLGCLLARATPGPHGRSQLTFDTPSQRPRLPQPSLRPRARAPPLAHPRRPCSRGASTPLEPCASLDRPARAAGACGSFAARRPRGGPAGSQRPLHSAGAAANGSWWCDATSREPWQRAAASTRPSPQPAALPRNERARNE